MLGKFADLMRVNFSPAQLRFVPARAAGLRPPLPKTMLDP